MKHKIKIFLLCLLLTLPLIEPINTWALDASIGWGGDAQPSGSNCKNPSVGTLIDYGLRVTFADIDPLLEAGGQHLTGDYTMQDVDVQLELFEKVNYHRYWKSGDHGLYFGGYFNPSRLGTHNLIDGSSNINEPNPTLLHGKGGATPESNLLAWYCYPGVGDGVPRTDIRPYNEELYNAVFNGGTMFQSGDEYVTTCQMLYSQLEQTGVHGELVHDLIGPPTTIGPGLREFSWDIGQYSGYVATPQDRVYWQRIGYTTMLMQFCWLAKDTPGHEATYALWSEKLYNWVASDFADEKTPVLHVEACQLCTFDGTLSNLSKSNMGLFSVPASMLEHYNWNVAPMLYNDWGLPDQDTGTKKALAQAVAGHEVSHVQFISQGLGYGFTPGGITPKNQDRAYCRQLVPVMHDFGNIPANEFFGYNVGHSLLGDFPGSRTPGVKPDPPAKFTWELDPHGVHEMTPDK